MKKSKKIQKIKNKERSIRLEIGKKIANSRNDCTDYTEKLKKLEKKLLELSNEKKSIKDKINNMTPNKLSRLPQSKRKLFISAKIINDRNFHSFKSLNYFFENISKHYKIVVFILRQGFANFKHVKLIVKSYLDKSLDVGYMDLNCINSKKNLSGFKIHLENFYQDFLEKKHLCVIFNETDKFFLNNQVINNNFLFLKKFGKTDQFTYLDCLLKIAGKSYIKAEKILREYNIINEGKEIGFNNIKHKYEKYIHNSNEYFSLVLKHKRTVTKEKKKFDFGLIEEVNKNFRKCMILKCRSDDQTTYEFYKLSEYFDFNHNGEFNSDSLIDSVKHDYEFVSQKTLMDTVFLTFNINLYDELGVRKEF